MDYIPRITYKLTSVIKIAPTSCHSTGIWFCAPDYFSVYDWLTMTTERASRFHRPAARRTMMLLGASCLRFISRFNLESSNLRKLRLLHVLGCQKYLIFSTRVDISVVIFIYTWDIFWDTLYISKRLLLPIPMEGHLIISYIGRGGSSETQALRQKYR